MFMGNWTAQGGSREQHPVQAISGQAEIALGRGKERATLALLDSCSSCLILLKDLSECAARIEFACQ